jgi:hypothetical protein
MAAFSAIIGAIGLGLSAAGTFMQYSAAKDQAKYNAQAYQLQAEAEKQRQLQMNLEAQRKKREIVRNAIIARSDALAATTAAGAAGKGSSALPGAYGAISGQEGGQLLAVNQNQQIGNKIFDIHAQMFQAYSNAASAGSQAATGSGLSSIGGMLMKQNTTIGSFFGGPSTATASA